LLTRACFPTPLAARSVWGSSGGAAPRPVLLAAHGAPAAALEAPVPAAAAAGLAPAGWAAGAARGGAEGGLAAGALPGVCPGDLEAEAAPLGPPSEPAGALLVCWQRRGGTGPPPRGACGHPSW
jgi:hypothetical protein